MRNVAVFLKRGLMAVLVLAMIAGVAGLYYFKSYLPKTVAPRSFPQIDGQIQLEGLDAPVDIYRDQMGVPNIYADTQHDLFFAQGYVHAQERFWQMDAWRHIGSGTLSEMFGKVQVDTDTFLRTLGWKQVAEQEWQSLDPEYQGLLQAYADGVNAYLKDHMDEALSLEYAVLKLLSPDYKVEPWTPANTLQWGKMLAWDLRGNMDEEIERAILLKTLTPEQVNFLFPPYPTDHPTIVPKIGMGTSAVPTTPKALVDIPDETLATLANHVAVLDRVVGHTADGIGSNSWVVAGPRTSTGMPLLANDPHLAIQMPSIWYQIGLHCRTKSDQCPYEVTGFSMAGVPGIIIGHNDHIAWGFTNAYPDVMDLYIERENPENPNQYEVNGQWMDFETRKETINVGGGETVEITVRLTRHGPVLSDSYGVLKDQGDPKDKEFVPFQDKAGIELPENYVIALKWTAFTPASSFLAFWKLDKAENFEQFRDAARDGRVPSQNLPYADVDGNIGYQMPGDIPIRKNGDGRLPVPGWTDDYEWTGYIPFEELPYTFNPAEGFIAPVNNQIPPDDFPYFISTDWDYGFRAQRIVDLIQNAPGKIDIAYFEKMQGDNYEPNAAILVPLILEAKIDSDLERARDLLKNWNYQASADSAPAALFEAFWRMLLKNTFRDDLPERYWPKNGSRWNEVVRNLVNEPNNFFWDDKATAEIVESRDDIIIKSFSEAVTDVQSMLGKDMSKWRWGQMHTSTFRNGTLGNSGVGLIDSLFNRGPFPTSGGQAIVNATAWYSSDSYAVTNVPSMRMIVDLSNLSNSVTVHTTGESGHAYQKHYDDMISMWANIQYYPMLWDEQIITPDTEGHLVLRPK
jgi:penicillin G amidase